MKILVIISASIAAYKMGDILREFMRQGWQSEVILTDAAQNFITPAVISGLTGQSPMTDLFTSGQEMEHIYAVRRCDLVLVCPATADIIAKMACGLADDLASTALLACDKPVLVVPAMNAKMYENPAMQENLQTLRRRGVQILPPAVGEMACGEQGQGRLPDIEIILDFMRSYNNSERSLAGLSVLLTVGATREAFDPVRYLSNYSSGKQGYAIVRALHQAGADVHVVSGFVEKDLAGWPCKQRVCVETADQMLEAVQSMLPVDIGIFTAAVCDWRPDYHAEKMKKQDNESWQPSFIENPDILQTVCKSWNKPRLTIGFSAETQNIVANSQQKRYKKGCDWVCANDVGQDNAVFGGENNHLFCIDDKAVEDWGYASKQTHAGRLVERIVKYWRES